ncbi:MAG: diguanylate cyclase [Phycisphaerales bacterium]|nr:diguanylate cyclase [Phycisphaerales bacterium]
MWGSKPVSVKTSIRMSLLGMLLVVTGTALITHEFLRRRDARQAGRERAMAFAQAVSQRFETGIKSSPKRWEKDCRRLLDLPDVLAVSIWDSSGRSVAQAAVTPVLRGVLEGWQTTQDVAPTVQSILLSEDNQTNGGPAHLVFTPLRGRVVHAQSPAKLGILLQKGSASGDFTRHFWSFDVPVGIVGILSLLLGSWWLRREVVRPLKSLVQVANSEGTDSQSADPFHRYSELGEIARALTALQEDLSGWRERAQQIERRVDSRIAEETQRITRDLKRMQREALRDPLTRIYNRRFLEEEYFAIFEAQKSSGNDLSVVMLDLDHFKILNDEQGHAAGDDILRFVGELLRQCLRASDFAVRYGGDEFVLILPGISAENALDTANRILSLFAQRAKMMVNVTPTPSITAGVASILKNEPSSHTELLALADQGLLSAKRDGKKQAQISKTRAGTSCSSAVVKS